MHLSSLLINVGDDPDRPRPGRRWVRNLYRVHQRLCMAFPSVTKKSEDANFLRPFDPGDFNEPSWPHKPVHVSRGLDSGFLFRIDPRAGGRVVLLVQSAVKPDWDYAFRNAEYLLAAPPMSKPYDPSFMPHEVHRFRLLANPTRKIDTKTKPDGKKNNGRRVPVPTDQLSVWLTGRSASAGFRVARLDNIQVGYQYFSKDPPKDAESHPSEKGRLRSVRYDGTLEVVDPLVFREAVMRGIGPGKAFGFGLLSVVPIVKYADESEGGS